MSPTIFQRISPLLPALPRIGMSLSPRDDPDVPHCEATTWYDLLLFYLLNYLAHAATAPSPSGARTRLVFQAQFFALLFPLNSLLKAVTLLFHRSIFGSDDIGMACAVGAVAVVARKKDWKPALNGETLVCTTFPRLFEQDTQHEAGSTKM